MIRPFVVALCAGLTLASSGLAQTADWRFHWKTGDVLTYRVEQATSASEVVDGKKTETTAKLGNTKRWQVLGVDGKGIATLQLSLTALRIEQVAPDGEVLLFDSANPDKSTPQMREQLSKYLGAPLAVLRIDSKGRLIEVKESKFGPPSRFESELPFGVTLPDGPTEVGKTWERAYAVTLEPPQGTGEKFDAVQRYMCKSVQGAAVMIGMMTHIKSLPAALLDQVPLLQMQPEGEVIFNIQTGRLQSAVLKVNKELKNHQGEGSSYQFQSTYSEQIVE